MSPVRNQNKKAYS